MLNRRYWMAVILPETFHDQEWSQGFPHKHGWDGLTLCHYLQAPERGGELVIYPEDDSEEITILPTAGTTSVIGGFDTHGVKRIYGSIPRITVMTAGYRKVQRSL